MARKKERAGCGEELSNYEIKSADGTCTCIYYEGKKGFGHYIYFEDCRIHLYSLNSQRPGFLSFRTVSTGKVWKIS